MCFRCNNMDIRFTEKQMECCLLLFFICHYVFWTDYGNIMYM